MNKLLTKRLFIACGTAIAIFPGSPFSQTLNIIPEAARAAAEAYLDEWVPRAKVNPEFYGVVGKELDRRDLTLLDGYIFATLYKPDAKRFAESAELDPTRFATGVMYVFPTLLKGEYVSSVTVRANKDKDGNKVSPDAGDYIRLGRLYPSRMDEIIEATTGDFGSSERIPFSVIHFLGGVGGTFVQLYRDGKVQLAPVNPAAFRALSLDGSQDGPSVLDAHEAAPRLKRRILQHKGFSE